MLSNETVDTMCVNILHIVMQVKLLYLIVIRFAVEETVGRNCLHDLVALFFPDLFLHFFLPLATGNIRKMIKTATKNYGTYVLYFLFIKF